MYNTILMLYTEVWLHVLRVTKNDDRYHTVRVYDPIPFIIIVMGIFLPLIMHHLRCIQRLTKLFELQNIAMNTLKSNVICVTASQS